MTVAPEMTALERGGAKLWTWVLLAAAFAAAILVPTRFGDAPQDDAYIAWIYSRNFARGDGLVFNAGEPALEGYVNFLWTFWIGLGMKLGMDPEQVVPWVGLLLTLATVFGTFVLARRLGAAPLFAALAALLFATRPTLAVHAMGGMETPAFGLFVLLGLLPRLRDGTGRRGDLWSSFWLALATLTRPEGVLIYGALELSELPGVIRDPSTLAARVRRALVRAIPFAVIVGAHFLFRKIYYGSFIPHVFHAKVDPSPAIWADGAEYLFYGLLYFGPVFLLLPYAVRAAEGFERARRTCLWLSSLYLVYPLYVGGDYVPAYRFLWPMVPVWSALAAGALTVLTRPDAGRVRMSSAAAAVVFLVLIVFHTTFERVDGHQWKGMHERHGQLVAAGNKLNEVLAEDAWIAATNVGRVPYFADRRTIDMMGLNDEHIGRAEMLVTPDLAGHLKGDGKYVLDRRPDVIFFLRLVVHQQPLAKQNWGPIAKRDAFGVSEKQILADPRFREEYRMYSIPLPDAGCWLNVFARDDVFAANPPEGIVVGRR